MGRDGEQRLRVLPDGGNQKVLDVLAGQNDRGVLFTHTLHGVADIFDCGHIGEEQIQLVNAGGCAAPAQKLIAHEGQNVEEHGVFQALVGIQQAFHAEHQEVAAGDVGVAVEVFAFCADAHGMDAETDLLQRFFGIEVLALLVVAIEFFLTQLVEVLHDGKVGWLFHAVIRAIGNAEPGIQLREQDLYGVDLRIGEVLIRTKEIFQKGDVLAQPGNLSECLRRCPVHLAAAIRPRFRLQGIDGVLAG